MKKNLKEKFDAKPGKDFLEINASYPIGFILIGGAG
jgi:hypothetical protein